MDRNRQPRGIPSGGEFASQSRPEAGISLTAPAGWPGISWEEHPWDAVPDRTASRRRQLLARGPYRAAVPPVISSLDPTVDSRILALTEAATVDMVRFDTEMGQDAAPFAELLLRTESASSSQIENLTAGARRIALARIGDTSSANATLIASNVRAVTAAVDLSENLSVKNIAVMHYALLASSDQDIAGHYRESQVWIRGNSPHTAEFVPPHHDRVPDAMEDLVRFMARGDMPALVQAAVAHAQFETIHPFADGNGRTGRAIVSALLRAKEVTRNVTIPVSSGLLTDTGMYFDALDAYRSGDIAPITEMFALAALKAVDNGRRLTADIRTARSSWDDRGRLPASSRQVLDLLPGEPAVTAEMVAESTGVSTATAYRTLQRLQDAGVIAPAGKIHGAAVWVAPDIIEALDAFAARAGRRRR